MTFVFEIPDGVLAKGSLTREKIEAEVRKELALALYRGSAVSEGKAAEIAGLNRFEFSKLLGERGVERNYGMEDLRQDLEFVRDCKASAGLEKSAARLKG
ncbi:MAG TPA: UPF0175 family protein [Verrucomicrobiae bacterium]|nr:UPF0175 family protein [Verrucomicrobiae bacterium]